MAVSKIKKGDTVVAIAGKDKGKQGTVVEVCDNKAKVSGLNIATSFQKANPQANVQGGIIKQEAFLDVSNIAILNPLTNKADRVGIKLIDNNKVRYFKSNGEVIDIEGV